MERVTSHYGIPTIDMGVGVARSGERHAAYDLASDSNAFVERNRQIVKGRDCGCVLDWSRWSAWRRHTWRRMRPLGVRIAGVMAWDGPLHH